MNSWNYKDIFYNIVKKQYPIHNIKIARDVELNNLIFLFDEFEGHTTYISKIVFSEKEIIMMLRKYKLKKII